MFMEDEPPRRRRSPWGVIALVLLSGLAMMRNGSSIDDGPPQPTAASAVKVTADQLPVEAPRAPVGMQLLDHSSVQRIRIPSISVDAPVMTVGG